MISDCKFALRSLRRSGGLVAAVLLTLGLGIGITSAVFSLVDHVLLRPLPYREPERLVRIWGADRSSGQRFQELSFQDYHAILRHTGAFDSLAAFSLASRRLESEAAHPSEVSVARITLGFLELLGERFELGRGFTEDEVRREERVVVLSYDLWQSRFGGGSAVLGSDIDLRGEPHRVVGVLPAAWRYPGNVGVYRPLYRWEQEDDDREYFVVGRLAAGISPDQASPEVAGVVEGRADAQPSTRGRHTAWVQPLQAMLVRDVRSPFLLLMAAVGAVLLIVCLNVANLLLARGFSRRPEMALRSALGAGRPRLVRLMVWESLLLSCGGGVFGLLLGTFALQVLVALAPAGVPRLDSVSLDARVVSLVSGTALLCGLLSGIIPAWLESRPILRTSLAAPRSGLGSWGGARARRWLVILEVALATVLVIVAGLFSSSLQRMMEFDRGFSDRGLLEVKVGPSQRVSHGSAQATLEFYEGIRTRLGSLPGVRSVSLSSFSPMEPVGLRVEPAMDGVEFPRGRRVQLRFVSANFLRELGIRLREGRHFDAARDVAAARPVAIVNLAFVQEYLKGGRPDGRLLGVPALGGQLSIVGVAEDLRPKIGSAPVPAIYVPFEQCSWAYMFVFVGVEGDPSQAVPMVREQIWSVAPDVSLESFRTLDQMVSETLAEPRFGASLVGIFALLALVLAATGLYGVVSNSVSCQSSELAIRRALGARGRGVAWLVLRRGLALVLVGVGLGIPLALGVGWALSSQLFEIHPASPQVYLPATLFLGAVGTLASFLPARRASRLDPAEVLRGN